MLQAKGTYDDGKDGKPMMILGLEAENVRRLQAGEPIQIEATHLGFPGYILIMVGETAEEMAVALGFPVGEAKPLGVDHQPKKAN